MPSSRNGTATSDYEVTNIERFGFWLYNEDKEYFIGYEQYPEFKSATVEQILNVKRIDPTQFRWEDLDVDIDIRSIEAPEDFPLKYR